MYDLTIELTSDTGKCLYEQIYEYIRQEIQQGKVSVGERLPSTRALADHLQVARSTVEMAYAQLLSEGYIESRPYKGYFVAKVEELFQFLENQETKRYRAVNEENEERGPKITCDFSPTKIDMSKFPFSVWKKISKNILSDSNAQLFSQGDAQGDLELRETIAKYLHSSRGVNCRPEQIVVGAGSDYLLMLLEKILGEKVRIAMENPTYLRAYKIFHSFGYPITTVDVDENGMKVTSLKETDAKLVYVMPSHQYPTGVVMPIGRRNELLKWAAKNQERYLIEDDYDSEFRYKGKPIPSLQASDKNGKVIYMGTFSKSIAPAIRVAYMVLPDSLLERYREHCYFYSTTVSRIDQRILDEFIKEGYFERYLNKMRKVYRDKHDLLLKSLEVFEGKFEISGENAGLHILMTSKCGESEDVLIGKAAEQAVKVYGLSESCIGTEKDSSTVILGYGGLTETEITDGVKKLAKAWLDK
jgi:GntR family transcriptional regulator/MocR family aminotransferase